jgi:hypothetical protein
MVQITVSMRFPETDPYAHSETRVYVGDDRDFQKWLDRQTGPGGKWVKWSRQSTVTFRHR